MKKTDREIPSNVKIEVARRMPERAPVVRVTLVVEGVGHRARAVSPGFHQDFAVLDLRATVRLAGAHVGLLISKRLGAAFWEFNPIIMLGRIELAVAGRPR